MKAIKIVLTILLMIASMLSINVRGQNADKFVLKKLTSAYQDQYGTYHSTTLVYSSDSLPKNYKSPTLKDVEELAAKSPVALSEVNIMQTVTKLKDPALDTCKREYIALSRSYEDLKQDYADAVYINSMDKIYAQKAHEKELKKAKRKRWFNGFLWGNVVGILALAFVIK